MVVAMDKCTARERVRDAYRDDVKVILVKEKNMYTAYGDVHKPKIQFRSLHKPYWCAYPRSVDVRSILLTILASYILHKNIEHKNALL